MQIIHNRRRFLTGLTATGAASLVGAPIRSLAEPPPETTTIRLSVYPAACNAPIYLAEELLRAEGFTAVLYVPATGIMVLADGDADFGMEAAVDFLPLMDAGRPLAVLSGIHVGCFELRANDSIQTITDLRGKRVGVSTPLGVSADYLMVSVMASYVGLNPTTDINWVTNPEVGQPEQFAAGEIDAYIGFPPSPQQPCARHLGRVIVNTATDRPWSNYFCCMAAANADFVHKHPVATKRALRAILKAADICHTEPDRAVARMAGVGFSAECAAMILSDARYGLWREYDPEDSVRFFSLRLHEAGLIKKSPGEIIAGFTDWRFLNEAKRELKS